MTVDVIVRKSVLALLLEGSTHVLNAKQPSGKTPCFLQHGLAIAQDKHILTVDACSYACIQWLCLTLSLSKAHVYAS